MDHILSSKGLHDSFITTKLKRWKNGERGFLWGNLLCWELNSDYPFSWTPHMEEMCMWGNNGEWCLPNPTLVWKSSSRPLRVCIWPLDFEWRVDWVWLPTEKHNRLKTWFLAALIAEITVKISPNSHNLSPKWWLRNGLQARKKAISQ